MLEIRPSRSSVGQAWHPDSGGDVHPSVPFAQNDVSRATSAARPGYFPSDKVPLRLHRWQGGLQGSEKLQG
jgi:hypothetical protein